jgi:hypothetical protein
MPADQPGNAPARDHSDSATAGQEPCRDGLALATRPALRAAGTPQSMTAHLTRLRAAFPAFSFSIQAGWQGLAFEAWREPATAGLYAVITSDASELWHELEQCKPDVSQRHPSRQQRGTSDD